MFLRLRESYSNFAPDPIINIAGFVNKYYLIVKDQAEWISLGQEGFVGIKL